MNAKIPKMLNVGVCMPVEKASISSRRRLDN